MVSEINESFESIYFLKKSPPLRPEKLWAASGSSGQLLAALGELPVALASSGQLLAALGQLLAALGHL